MTRETLGDRIRAKRERTGEGAASRAKQYVDKQVKAAVKKYVDEQITKLCEKNGLTPP